MEGSNNLYYVEKILDKKVIPLRYLVKWEGYGNESSTWEPFENLQNVPELLEEFEKDWERQMLRRKRDTTRPIINKTPSNSSEDKSEKKKDKIQNSKKSFDDDVQNHPDINKVKKIKPKHNDKQKEKIKTKLEAQEIPTNIKTAKVIEGILCCMVEFSERSDGIQPEPKFMASDYLADCCPNLLIEFYESKIKFL